MRTLIGMAVLICGTAVARAQEPPPNRQQAEQGPNADQSLAVQPIGPVQTGTVADAQFFRMPDLTQIGTNPELNYGPFFQYERIYWSLRQPQTTQVGDPGVAAGIGIPNDLDTGFMKAGFVWGNRFDIGYVQDDETGWRTSILKTNTQFNTLSSATPEDVFFVNHEPTFITGTPYVLNTIPTFSTITISNTTRMVGVELMRSYRYPVQHDGGIWTFLYGARYFQLHDRYDIEAQTVGGDVAGTATGETLETSVAPNSWDLGIDNNLVGPQIGLEWEHDDNRWVVGTSLRAMFAANFQNATLFGYSGSGTVDVVTAGNPNAGESAVGIPGEPINTFHATRQNVTFAPLGELRLHAEYKVTSNVSLTVGYTAILASGIGRASDRIQYILPDSGILNGADKQHFFADGISMGFEVNR